MTNTDTTTQSTPSNTTESVDTVVTVLIVDDHAGYRDLIELVVEATPNFEVYSAVASSEDMFDLLSLSSEQPDLVLMDVNLDGESGIDATRRFCDNELLRSSAPSSRVLLCSTLSEDELPLGARGCGAVGYFPKAGMSPSELQAAWSGDYDW